jgi:hypothetical protein
MPAFYIVLQEKIPGVDATGMEGRALSKHSETLEGLAKQASVKPLLSFFSANPEEASGLLDEGGVGQPDVAIPDEQWFQADEGLATIAALLLSLAAAPSAEALAMARELVQFQHVLKAARSRNIRWHLGIDY